MKMSEQDKIWQAESDARTLADAFIISNDPKRLKEAKKQAKIMEKEAKERIESLKNVNSNTKTDLTHFKNR